MVPTIALLFVSNSLCKAGFGESSGMGCIQCWDDDTMTILIKLSNANNGTLMFLLKKKRWVCVSVGGRRRDILVFSKLSKAD